MVRLSREGQRRPWPLCWAMSVCAPLPSTRVLLSPTCDHLVASFWPISEVSLPSSHHGSPPPSLNCAFFSKVILSQISLTPQASLALFLEPFASRPNPFPTHLSHTPWPLPPAPAPPWGAQTCCWFPAQGLPPSYPKRPSWHPSPWLPSPRLPSDFAVSTSSSRPPGFLSCSCREGGQGWAGRRGASPWSWSFAGACLGHSASKLSFPSGFSLPPPFSLIISPSPPPPPVIFHLSLCSPLGHSLSFLFYFIIIS